MTVPAKVVDIASKASEIIEAVIIRGDLADLRPDERAKYYVRVCESIGVNPMTRPFEYITLNGRLTLYARKDCTDQLRTLHNVSVLELGESEREGVFIVTAKVQNAKGRIDASKGAVTIAGLKGEALANAMMKAETKAKRRATLSICGLGFLDETEIEDIPDEHKGPQVKRLPKKDARQNFDRLQQEMRDCDSLVALESWGKANGERIRLLPEDWEDIMRAHFLDRRIELQNGDPADKVVWDEKGERPATADDEPDDGIPTFLDRRTRVSAQPMDGGF